MDIKKEIKKLKNLNCYKDKTNEELKAIIKEKQLEKEKYQPIWNGLQTADKKWANDRFTLYKSTYSIDNPSDIHLLEDLVFYECLQEQYKKKVQDLTKASADISSTVIIPDAILKSLESVQSRLMTLKEKLGLFEERKKDDVLSVWLLLKKKILKHAQENSGAFTFKCPSCGNLALLVKKIDNFNTCDFKMFKGTYLYNEHMFKLLDENKITKEDIAKFFGLQSVEYIDKIYEKLYLPEKRSKDNQEVK